MPRVILQAGHSSVFPPYRASGGGAPGEAAWTTDLAIRVRDLLRTRGVEVVTVGSWLSGQTEYPAPPEMKRDADLFCALHYDAAIYGADNTGCFYDRWSADSRRTADESTRAGAVWERIYPAAVGIPLRNNRRNVNTSRYYAFRAKTANTPGIIIECGVGQGFDKDNLFDGIDIVADATALAILKYLGISTTLPIVLPPTPPEEPDMTPEQQQLLDAAASWSIDDAGELNFMMGTRKTLAEQVQSLEGLKNAAQSERDQYMAEVERLKAVIAAQSPAAPVEDPVVLVMIKTQSGKEYTR